MKAKRTNVFTSAIAIVTMVSISTSVLNAVEPPLPPNELKGKWNELEKEGFEAWDIAKFSRWGGVADGGSIIFDFIVDDIISFEVVIANRNYWTEDDKLRNIQVIYLIKNGRFFLLHPKSLQEKRLVKMLSDHRDSEKIGKKDMKAVLEKLIDTVSSREPVNLETWPVD